MDEPTTFGGVLRKFEDAYVNYQLGETGPEPMVELRNSVQMKLAQLQNQVTEESKEVADFSTTYQDSGVMTQMLAEESRGLKYQVERAQDESGRSNRLLAGLLLSPPPANYTPLYARIGIVIGVMLLLPFIPARR